MAELSLLVKVTVVLILALAAAWLGSRRSAAVRSLILACAFGVVLLLPVASLTLPARAIELPATYSLPFAGEFPAAVAPVTISPRAVDIAQAPSSRVWMPSMRVALLLLWGTGVIVFIAPLTAGLFRLRRVRAHGRPWVLASLPSSIDVLLNDELRIPIAFGVRRPVIALPGDAPQWAEADLRRVLLHELEHVRRRDWPVQMAARAVCAFYWFHPLVWIAWRKLCLESERACDDAVLREDDGTAYAALLVSLARRITKQDALPLLSIAGRSNLSTRVAAMLARDVERGRVRVGAVVGLAAVAALAALTIAPLRAVLREQRPGAESSASGPRFESVSIPRAVVPPEENYKSLLRYGADGRVTASKVDLVDLIVSAYSLYRWQVVDAPAWANTWESPNQPGLFDVQATARRGANEDDMRQMMRTMLADRFRLRVHRENRVQKIYELVVEPGGHKLPPSGRKYVPSEDVWLRNDPNPWTARLDVDGITMTQLARNLGLPMETLVIDRTGLSGVYRVTAKWGSVPGTREIFEAFPAQLGLRFQEATGPVEYLIIDHAERPTLDAR